MPHFRRLYLLFFLSGFPALLYQIVWQRALFSIYGVNIESVTVVVSAFMLGLGLGSLAGGWLSERPRVPLLLAFGVVELGIAVYGLFSLALFRWVAGFSAGAGVWQAGLLAFLLVVIPTVLMGATLPLLVAHLVRHSGNVGRSVGILYFVNTLGSAAACFAAAFWTMPRLGMSGTVILAAAMNILVGCTVLALHVTAPAPACRPASTHTPAAALPTRGLHLPAALLLSAAAGFISLGYEILAYRVYAFLSGGTARGFAVLLGAYLGGIAFGSLASCRFCRQTADIAPVAGFLAVANQFGFVAIPLIAIVVRYCDPTWSLLPIALAAALLGAAFPLICHIAVPPDTHAGAATSYLYLANILGSTLGSFIVGFVLMDLLSLPAIALALSIPGVAMGALLLPSRRARLGVGLGSAFAFLLFAGPLYDRIYEKLQYRRDYHSGIRFTDRVENRNGVITVDREGTVFGGGHYDGMLVTDLRNDAPLRPYAVSFFHPAPRQVLVIGMAGGAWVEVMANHPQVERITTIEINPGYLEIIRRYAQVAPILHKRQVDIHIDDGRRWLHRHPDTRYDLILMDTTSHWRAHATGLLSREFLELARRHLKPGGILYYNTSHSAEAEQTALAVFPYLYRFGRFLACSDSPIPIDPVRWRNILTAYRVEGEPLFNLAEADDRARLEEVLAWAGTLARAAYDEWGMEDRESLSRRVAGHRIVTDDNMACEWYR